MEKLEIFAKIKGVGAASGLLLKQNSLFIISDNGAHLYQYDILKKHLDEILLLPDLVVRQNIPKASKPDFEVLCSYQDTLYILGSGSTPKRTMMIEYHLASEKIIRRDIGMLYAKLKKRFAIDDQNLNIEGAIFTGNDWFLFNRGNGNANKNGIFKIIGSNLANAKQMEFTPLMLLTNSTVASFTDAVLHQDQIYFIAAAEDTTSTFDDGKILGSYIGSISTSSLNLNFTKKISSHQKFEGITFFRQHQHQIEFLICEDTDKENLETIIYKITL
jgi:hypothetical protein